MRAHTQHPDESVLYLGRQRQWWRDRSKDIIMSTPNEPEQSNDKKPSMWARARARERSRAESAATRARMEELRTTYDTETASVADIRLSNGVVRHRLKFYPLDKLVIEYADSPDKVRMTATRIAAGTLLAGPVGTAVGAMSKKHKKVGYVTLMNTDTGDVEILEMEKGDTDKARKFVMKVQLVQERGNQRAAAKD